MRYVSTRGRARPLGFDDVLLEGLATDGGLYVPEIWPQLESPLAIDQGYPAAAAAVMAPYVQGSVIESELPALVRSAYARFRDRRVAPLTPISDRRYLLELFWGPTLSFKDYALQLVGELFDRVLGERGRKILILGATSGDTGSAAIEACRDREAIDIVVLYPHGRISEVQRRQMTTVPSANVRAVGVEGTFDDCQDLVKAAFADEELRRDVGLAAVNSINWARIMAQAVYHFWAAAQVGRPCSIVVPTGNFGNVYAGYVARAMGAPIDRLVVANNVNHGVASLVASGRLPRHEVVPSLAPAMDIQVPSNLERYLFELYDRSGPAVTDAMAGFREHGAIVLDEVRHAAMAELFGAGWSDDARIEESIRRVFEEHGLVVDPHTATAFAAADDLQGDAPAIVVATAHPAKFPDAIARATGSRPALPADLADLSTRPERTALMENDLESVRRLLRAVSLGEETRLG